MLNKNEIKLFDEKDGRTILRLVVSKYGYVPPIHDIHYRDVAVCGEHEGLPLLKLGGASPTQQVREDDYVIERITEGDKTRFEMSAYYGGRLRSLSLANHLGDYNKLIAKHRDIQKWFDPEIANPERTVWVHKLFPNMSYNFPESHRTVLTSLRQFLPGNLLKDNGAMKLDPLVTSTHKFYRMLTKKTLDLKHHAITGALSAEDFQDASQVYFEVSKDGRNSKFLENVPPEGTRVVEMKIIGWALYENVYKPIYDLRSFIATTTHNDPR